MNHTGLLLLCLFTLAGQSAQAAPPFSGTIFIDPDIITASDPTTFTNMAYAGQGIRLMYDRRVNAFTNLNAYLFNARFDDGLATEIQVNPEFGNTNAASLQARKYGIVIGRLPTASRARVQTVWIHQGVQPFGGGNNNLLIHIGQAALYEADGILEETFVHESGHTSLDPVHASASGWLAAQAADPEFISTYARDNPTREDIAESYLPWLAIRHRPNRISTTLFNTITSTIPNRLAYFDRQNFNMYPIVQEIVVYTGAITNAANERIDNVGTSAFPVTLFGSISAPQTFTIKNKGGNDLTGLALTATGLHPGEFILSPLGVTTLAPNASTTFTVAFSPTTSGTRNAIVNIASNDGNENPFRVRVSGFCLPLTPPRLQNVAQLGDGSFRFDFTNSPNVGFVVLASTNLALPLSNWTGLGSPTEAPAGQYQFTDRQATNSQQRFYLIRSPD
jgi:hypothetical protein